MLGPVELRVAGKPVDAGPARQRCVLAALATDAGRPVPVDTLVARVWDENPPARARHALHVYIARIRRVLATANGHEPGSRVVRRNGGYQLEIEPDRVDVLRFRRLAARARDRSRPDPERVDLLNQALELWPHDLPLADLSGGWPARTREGWLNDYLDVVMVWADAMLRTGEADATVSRLEGLAVRYPLNESLVAVLMRSLHGAGRGAEALAWFARIRSRLVEELGTDPGPELRAVHEAILRGDQSAARPPASQPAPTPPVLAQLPADPAGFVGRRAALAGLDRLLAGIDGTAPTGCRVATVSAVSGTAGVGKTALALHWAHRVADRFPDGQLYVNLRGFDPGGEDLAPAEAIRGFLDALGVSPERLPPDLEMRTALYRSLLAHRRLLLVLDNARDAAQVRPLLPGSSTCRTVVTSRDQLTGLVAAEAAHPVVLDVLSPAEAREVLVRRLGADRVAAEPQAVDEVVAVCARLPLALTIAAARAEQTGFPMAAVAAELANAGRRLDVLDTGDPAAQVRAVLSWSYRALSRPAARLFRLLGTHPGVDISVAAAASLGGEAAPKSRQHLTELTRANLVSECRPDRYAFHDLLRAYALERAHDEDPVEEHRGALLRLLDHYAHTAYAADLLLYPPREAIDLPLGRPAPGSRPERLAVRAEAAAWLSAEHPVLIAVQRLAADAGFDAHVWQLAWALDTFLDWHGHWAELVRAWRAAIEAAERLGDLPARAYAHRLLAYAHTRLEAHADAQVHLGRALGLYTQAGDQVGLAHTHRGLTYLFERHGDVERAFHHAHHALILFQAAGHHRGEALALNNLGWFHAQLGDHEAALVNCEQALLLFQRLGDHYGEANACDSLGFAQHRLGQHGEAADRYQRALDLFRNLGDRYNEATTLLRIGDTCQAAGQPDQAETAWQAALAIFTDLRHPDADTTRARLVRRRVPEP